MQEQRSPFQKLSPKQRLLLALAALLFITALPRYHPRQTIAFSLFLLSLSALAQLPLSLLFQRLRLLLPFLLLLLLFLPFSSGRGPFLSLPIGTFQIRLYAEGLATAGLISLKALFALVVLSVLTHSTPFQELIEALEQIHLPRIMLLLLGFLYRYLPTLKADAFALRRAQNLRAFGKTGRAPIATLGSLIGTLFLRSYERSERVYLAMRARGFQREKASLQTPSFPSSTTPLLLLFTLFLLKLKNTIFIP